MNTVQTTSALAALLLGAAALSAAACSAGSPTSTGTGTGGSGTGGATATTGTGGSGPTVEAACADLAKVTCAKRDTCSEGFLTARVFGDVATCEARTSVACVTALAAPGTSQTPGKLEECVAAYPGYSCVDFFDNAPPDACAPDPGAVAQGAACGVSAQCASTYCAIAATAACGTCEPLPQPGDICVAQNDCGRALGCARLPAAANGVCAAWVDADGGCRSGAKPCKAGLSCVGEDVATSTDGVCTPSGIKAGDACDGSRKTLPACDIDLGLACIPAMKGSPIGTCKAMERVGAGMPCGDIGSKPPTGFAVCKAGGLCKKAAAGDTTGVCVDAAPDGAACDTDPTKGPLCLAPSRCIVAGGGTAGTCQTLDPKSCK